MRSGFGQDIYIDPSKTACFTGHRPEKFPFDTKVAIFLEVFKIELGRRIREAADAGIDTFLCGMQRGTDIWAGQEILRAKNDIENLRLICVSPFREEILSRKGADEFDYLDLKDKSDGFIALKEAYSPQCFIERNRFMVDNSSLIIGAICDRRSGTGQTLAYARKKGIKVEEIDLSRLAEEYRLYD